MTISDDVTINTASTWSDGRTRLWSGAMINNNATLDIQTDADTLHWNPPVSTFNNNGSGSITKSAGTEVTVFDLTFDNAGWEYCS